MIFDIKPISEWDIMSIIYSLIASAIIFIIIRWLGITKRILYFFKNREAYSKYKKHTIEECNSLIVVGKRKGFALGDVYVPLDLTKSDLIQGSEFDLERQKSFVLLGGPGAGKSTTAKNMIIKHFDSSTTKNIPFFIRLKDYNGDNPIFSFLVNRFESYGFINAKETVKRNLSNHTLCILDGLDEVRPNLREKICAQINNFFSDYFSVNGRLIVTCRKEAYRDLPLNITPILEVRPLSDIQIQRFAAKWPLDYPKNKSKDTFFRDLTSSPKILEIARSPLLLVGGLMHYTEANLGIPEERFEYLQTMSKWLVVDWATAQGHTPDSYRNVYDRILTSLSFHMHKNKLSEIPIDDASAYIGQLLPNFGYRKEEADAVLHSINIKTGILVKDGNNIFFAQFGLQEFFTSKEIGNQVAIKDISKLNPITWWREAILLYVAQLKDPTDLLSLLFKSEPFLAIAAVAECPTPSITSQREAVECAISYIDKKDTAIKGSLIPLLRKMKDNIELNLYCELEKRLTGDEQIASIVGVSLALAGTSMANNVLAKHPEVWHICLNEAGYLSASFENLLVEWIQEGENLNSFKAADLLSKRITSDRIIQLVNILPSLNKKKREHLSNLLLKELMQRSTSRTIEDLDKLSLISELIPNITSPNRFISEIAEQNKRNLKRTHYYSTNIIPSVLIAFFLKKKNENFTSIEILSTFTKASLWCNNIKSFILWNVSAILLLLINVKNPALNLLIFCLLTIIYFVSFISRQRHYSFLNNHYSSNRFNTFKISLTLFYILGGLTAIYLADYFGFFTINNITHKPLLFISLVLAILGNLIWDSGALNIYKERRNLIPVGFIFPLSFNVLFLSNILLVIFLEVTGNSSVLIHIISSLIAITYLVWLSIITLKFLNNWKRIIKAKELANSELDTYLQMI